MHQRKSDKLCPRGASARTNGLLSALVAVPILSANLFAQTPTLSGNNAFTGTNTFPVINKILYVDGVKNTTLGGALSSCPSNGCIVYTTIPEAWNSNVLGTAPVGTHIYFGAGNWTTTVTQILPPNVIVTGEAGRNAGQQGTSIQAALGFPTSGAAVLQLGSTGAVEGIRVENLTIDCNNVANATGIIDIAGQEKSGGRDVLVTACPAVGVDLESGASGSVWENLEVFAGSWNNNCSHCVASTLLLKVSGPGNVSFRNITLNGFGPSTLPTVGAQISNSITHFEGSIHCESVGSVCFDLSSITDMYNVS